MIVSTISEKVDKSDVDSISSVTIKDEPGTLSRAYSVTSEPPAYKKPTSSSVRIARLIAVTVVAVALILGTAIVVAAYLQSRNNGSTNVSTPVSSTETNKAATIDLPSALTGDAPNGSSDTTSSESSSEANDDDKDHRRLDTDGDLLEEFLENEGKILRLPTDGDLDIDIDQLAKMFLSRNPLGKSKCVVERRPIGGDADVVTVMPITKENATKIPLISAISGERISINCSTDDDESSTEDDAGLIQSRPILMPFGLRPNMRISPFNPLGGMPISSMSVIGPIPFMMNHGQMNPGQMSPRPMMPGPMMPPRAMRPPMPFGINSPAFDLNNALLNEQRSFNIPPPPSSQIRSPFQTFPAGQPIRFSDPFPSQNRPLGPVPRPNPFPSHFQSFQQQRPPFVPSSIMDEKPIHLHSDPMMEFNDSQEKLNVPEQHLVAPPAMTPRTPIIRQRQPDPILPDFPASLLSLLDGLPDFLDSDEQTEQPDQTDTPDHPERLSTPPGEHSMPTFRIPKLVLSTPKSDRPNADTTVSTGSTQLPARPVTLPFPQVPPFPVALGNERLPLIPLDFPFLNLGAPIVPRNQTTSPERRQERTSFFERLMDSILSAGNRNPQNKNDKTPADSMPVETRMLPPIRVGGRGLRMPDDGIIVASPIDSEEQDPTPGPQRNLRAHFIQPRSLKVN